MLMKKTNIRLMQDREFRNIPINKIEVLNSRNRDRARFEENIRSIRNIGLLKPIVVNGKFFEKNNYYELVCGQGRFLAYKELGYTEIPAEVIDCTRKNAYLYSLVENIARVPPGTIWFAREVKRMRDSGMALKEICTVTGKGENYIRDYICLVEQGEERLIRGVENGLISISFARKVARSKDANIQNLLMDAFDNGVVNSGNFPTVKKMLDQRSKGVKKPRLESDTSYKLVSDDYTVQQLKRDILKITKEKEAFVNETEIKENRLITLLEGLHVVCQDEQLIDLIDSEKIGHLPKLKGAYNVA
jgi:ParB family chromosome partitioning protein